MFIKTLPSLKVPAYFPCIDHMIATNEPFNVILSVMAKLRSLFSRRIVGPKAKVVTEGVPGNVSR